MRKRSLIAAGMFALAALLTAGAGRAENRIESVTIASEDADEIVLTIVYSYDGDRGADVAISAVMAQDGEPSTHYAYRPGRAERGRHRAQVRLGTAQGAPAIFATNQVQVAMYVGGGEAFVSRLFSYPKTWSRPGAELAPVLQLAQLRQRPALHAPARAILAPLEQASPAEPAAVERRILPDGAVELRYPDGTIRKLFGGGVTTTRPDGTQSTMLFQHAQPPTPPSAPPDPVHASWLEAKNEGLLDIMRLLVDNDEPSIQNYLAREGDRSVYQRIDARTEAIDWLVSP